MDNPIDTPLPVSLLNSRFDGAHLIRVDEAARLIAVWNGSETINLYSFTLDEVGTGPHMISRDEDGNPPSHEEVDQHMTDLFEEYASN